MDNKAALHAYLSDSAHTRWHTFAAESGVSVSGLLEAISYRLPDAEPGRKDALSLTDLVVEARRVDALRRRRNRRV